MAKMYVISPSLFPADFVEPRISFFSDHLPIKVSPANCITNHFFFRPTGPPAENRKDEVHFDRHYCHLRIAGNLISRRNIVKKLKFDSKKKILFFRVLLHRLKMETSLQMQLLMPYPLEPTHQLLM